MYSLFNELCHSISNIDVNKQYWYYIMKASCVIYLLPIRLINIAIYMKFSGTLALSTPLSRLVNWNYSEIIRL